MTTVSMARAPASAAAPAAPPSGSSVRWALARVEGHRLLAHPLFMLGGALSTLFFAASSTDGSDSLFALAGGFFVVLGGAVGTFPVACLAASRARRDAAQDFYAGQPTTASLRTEAMLLSLAWIGLAGAALIVVAAIVLAGPDGALAVAGKAYTLRPLELAQGPLYLVMVGAFGVLVGSWSRRGYPAVIGALVLFLPPTPWLPWITFGEGVPQGFTDDSMVNTSVGWHLAGLVGLTALAAAGALARHDRRPRVVVLALAGLAATVAGIALGLPSGY